MTKVKLYSIFNVQYGYHVTPSPMKKKKLIDFLSNSCINCVHKFMALKGNLRSSCRILLCAISSYCISRESICGGKRGIVVAINCKRSIGGGNINTEVL